MQKIIVSILLLLISINTYSQNFERGQIIKNGEKFEGFIKYENWLKSPKNIQFRVSLNDTIQTIEADDIAQFTVHNEVYISKKVVISLYSDLPTSRNNPYQPKPIEGFYFLRIFFENQHINLYQMIDKNEGVHLFIEKDKLFQELLYSKRNLYNEQDILYLEEKKKYIGQLRTAFADCEAIKVSDNLQFEKEDILKLCNQYKQCKTDNSINFINKKQAEDKVNFSIGAEGGVFLNTENGSNWVTGVALRLNFPRNFRNTYVMIEGNYYKNNYPIMDFAGGALFAGTHFGKNEIRPFFNVGFAYFNTNSSQAAGVLGIGISWKRSFKFEYRRNAFSSATGFDHLSVGYMYNF
ncbi:hypothetical protein LV89_04957 [Arcicella aurantiaca]|uniref:Outer membrane protein with beta-barrel domain n=1 Tax=Arcicella aurantiaca TaxID=591202 RepID=A0A316DC86_9BACT|nr:hypothetical protein [Arcicella aurantiaca]PWK15757.1 hypothetical protein LV89_04957 [Arcicella aurantiaca]